MTRITVNGGKAHQEQPDSIDKLMEALDAHTLDPRFERYADKFISKDQESGTTRFFGSFVDAQRMFDLRTDERGLIEQLSSAIQKNRSTEQYKQARAASARHH
ncbi:hypothetical protein FO488_04660 [Geobacter sp. FeAm09]|uniref:hypothetical protein n=1 Tax=Geobacter sp. FeAm09 TaxID=2597769 RepID=UPI0011EF3917|nr:hypothetical protein [Geobacter sp. FeAm09]QEM67504.1 hypothetical protein FO488_04660 [Geobacter sp. FeAm09]